MKPASRLELAIASASVTNGATATASIFDTAPPGKPRSKFVSIDLVATTADVVSNKPQTLKVQHSNTTDVTNFADISGADIASSAPNALTSLPNLYKFNIDWIGKRRYGRVLFSPRTTMTVFGTVNHYLLDQLPNSAAEAGVLALTEI